MMLASLFRELKKRKVFRVLAAYLIAAWLLLQIADVLTSILSLPEWAPKLVLLMLVVWAQRISEKLPAIDFEVSAPR